jgi:2-polyprenyl-3-methyl-5-hydroxy-6-metoxy-1,4-benzoquinol methylase
MLSKTRLATMMKSGVNGVLGVFGLQLSWTLRPFAGASEVVSGSFLPYEELNQIGRRESFYIQDGYQARNQPAYFDDTGNTGSSDGWQNEVYRFAREIADQRELRSVIDIGCGSGHKLMKYFRDRETIGLDVEKTCVVLRRRYPERRWQVCDFLSADVPKAELVIASDVIEHLADPNQMLEFIQRIAPAHIIISTPDRSLLRRGSHRGPPCNPCHLREWTMAEFHAYVSEYFHILEHFISYVPQCTQCLYAEPTTTRTAVNSH